MLKRERRGGGGANLHKMTLVDYNQESIYLGNDLQVKQYVVSTRSRGTRPSKTSHEHHHREKRWGVKRRVYVFFRCKRT